MPMNIFRYPFHKVGLCLLLILLNFCATKAEAAESIYDTIELATSYLVKYQNADGGWPLVPGQNSDVETTAMVMQALILKGLDVQSSVIRPGVVYLKKHQKEDGSWNGNTAHTIFALMALARAKTDPEVRFKGLKWIKEAQNEDGSWGREMHQPGNPLYTSAVLAGLGQLGFNQSLSAVPKAADWLASRINEDGGWSMTRGTKSDLLVTSWVLQGLSLVYNIDEQLAWLKRLQNKDGGVGKGDGDASDPEITAYAILALHAGEDPLNTDKVAISYLRRVQQKDGSFVSSTPIELKQPTANLQTTSFVLWAIHAEKLKESRE